MLRNLILICLQFVLFPLYISGQVPGQQADPEIGIIEKLEDTIPADIMLIDRQGNPVRFGDLVTIPTVISFVYYRCPGICSPLMDGISEVIDKSDLKIGTDYQVVTISFDSREGPDLAEKKHRNYMSRMKNKDAARGWNFYTADSNSVARLTSAAGFRYKPVGNDFVHAAAIIMLSPDRKITRYLNGTYFQPFEFKLALLEASKGQSGPTINRILQYCYNYDPEGQGYVLNITRVSGILISIIALMIFGTLAIRPMLRKRQNKNAHI